MFWAFLSAGIILAVILGYISAWWLLLALAPLVIWFVLIIAAFMAVGMGNKRTNRRRY